MPSIFIIDDDRTYVKILSQYLKDQFEVYSYETAEESLSGLKENQPEYIIIDYFLPGMDGLQLFQRLKKEYDPEKLIVLSSNDDAAVVLDMIRQGVRSYIIKDENVIESLQCTLDGDDFF